MPPTASAPFARRLLATALLAPPAALAQSAAAPAGSGGFIGELLAILVPLALVIVVLLVVLRLIRRRYGLAGTDAPLSVVQILPLGPRERLVLVRARSGRQFAVGVGLHAVTYITDLDTDEPAPSMEGSDADGRIDTLPRG